MKRVLTAVVLIPLVLLVLFLAPLWLFALALAIAALVSTREYLGLVEAYGIIPFRRLTLLATTIIFLAMAAAAALIEYRTALMGTELLPYAWKIVFVLALLCLVVPLLFLVRGLKRPELRTVLPAAASSTFAFAYISLPFLAIFSLRLGVPLGATLILYMLVTVWAGDIAAYYVGRSFGRRRLAPSISPQKSWEGAVASFVTAGIVGTVILKKLYLLHLFFSAFSEPRTYDTHFPQHFSISIWLALLLSFGINIAGQLGDLVESMLKRGAGVKDSGNLLPGHGGMLDRIDALLFAAPVLWYYATFRLIPF